MTARAGLADPIDKAMGVAVLDYNSDGWPDLFGLLQHDRVLPRPQQAETVARLGEAIAARSPFELAALSPLVTITGSLVAALALLEGFAAPEDIWSAANLDEDWQAEHWGEDDLARKARAARRADFDAGARLLSLL